MLHSKTGAIEDFTVICPKPRSLHLVASASIGDEDVLAAWRCSEVTMQCVTLKAARAAN